MDNLSSEQIQQMDYVSFMGLLNETNRPPGGKDSMRRMAQNAFLTQDSTVLHSGCNTGYCSFELCHLTKCKVVAIDQNEKMIRSANERLGKEIEPYRSQVVFEKGDAHHLQFGNDTFDLVMSGGSTAFMQDKSKVVSEYVRVCKPYGFVGDVFMYYQTEPPQDLIERLNAAMGISIQKWTKAYWISLYLNAGLEEYYSFDAQMPVYPTDDEVQAYCKALIDERGFSMEARKTAIDKLYAYMTLFNENHKYLAYTVLLCRKSPQKEQIALFGT